MVSHSGALQAGVIQELELCLPGSASTVKKQVTVCGNKHRDRVGEGLVMLVSSPKAGIQQTLPFSGGQVTLPCETCDLQDSPHDTRMSHMTHAPSVLAGPLTCISLIQGWGSPLVTWGRSSRVGPEREGRGLSLYPSSSGQEDHSATEMLLLLTHSFSRRRGGVG